MDCTNQLRGLLVSTQGSPGHGRTTLAGQAAAYEKIRQEKQQKQKKTKMSRYQWEGGTNGPKSFVFLLFSKDFCISGPLQQPGSWICKNHERKANKTKQTNISRYQWEDAGGGTKGNVFDFVDLLLSSRVFYRFQKYCAFSRRILLSIVAAFQYSFSHAQQFRSSRENRA